MVGGHGSDPIYRRRAAPGAMLTGPRAALDTSQVFSDPASGETAEIWAAHARSRVVSTSLPPDLNKQDRVQRIA